MRLFLCFCLLLVAGTTWAEEPQLVEVWTGLPPGETKLSAGETLPTRANEIPPATRITKITQPQLEVYEPSPEKRTGVAVLIFPGGGFNYVVRDKEGEEPAKWLNSFGVTAFVVRYRTKDDSKATPSTRPLQDAQRAIRLVRSKAGEWNLNPNTIGIMGFSAGGNVAALASTRFDTNSYEPKDVIDRLSCRPDFAMLIYPAYLWDTKKESLTHETPVTDRTPPTFIVHTNDDGLSSLGPIYFYAALKRKNIPAEIHVYQVGGHGYGIRPVAGSSIHTWTEPAARWLESATKEKR